MYGVDTFMENCKDGFPLVTDGDPLIHITDQRTNPDAGHWVPAGLAGRVTA